MKERLVKISFSENFIMVDGWCLFSFVYNVIKIGVKIIMNIGFNDWN